MGEGQRGGWNSYVEMPLSLVWPLSGWLNSCNLFFMFEKKEEGKREKKEKNEKKWKKFQKSVEKKKRKV